MLAYTVSLYALSIQIRVIGRGATSTPDTRRLCACILLPAHTFLMCHLLSYLNLAVKCSAFAW